MSDRSCRLLLLDDHEDTLDLIQRFLCILGYEVEAARSISEARALCGPGKYDLLVMDIRLKDGDVYGFLEELAQQCTTQAIAMSGLCYETDIQRSLKAGFLAHVCKPVDLDELASIIDRYIDGRCAREQVA